MQIDFDGSFQDDLGHLFFEVDVPDALDGLQHVWDADHEQLVCDAGCFVHECSTSRLVPHDLQMQVAGEHVLREGALLLRMVTAVLFLKFAVKTLHILIKHFFECRQDVLETNLRRHTAFELNGLLRREGVDLRTLAALKKQCDDHHKLQQQSRLQQSLHLHYSLYFSLQIFTK